MRTGMRSATATPGASFAKPTNVRATGPAPRTGTSLVPSGGNRLPTAAPSSGAAGASNLPATTGSNAVTAAKAGPKATGSGFTYSRLGDRPMMGGMNPEDRIGGAFKSAAKGMTARSIATKAMGKAAGVLGLAVPDSTKTEPGNPVFRKTDTGKTQVAGYRSSTTPAASTTNTAKGMVGNMSRRSGMAPSVRNQELPAKATPVTTREPGTLSAPAPKAAPAATPAAKPTPAMSFKQAFAAARKEAGGGKGQFSFGDKQYQTNVNPAKGSERYVAPSAQKRTSVNVTPDTKSTPETTTPAPAAQSPGSSAAPAAPASYKEPPTPRRLPDSMGGSEPKTAMPSPTPAPEMKASVTAPTPKAEPSYSPDSPAGKAWANRGKFGTQQEDKKMVAESVTVGNYKYRIV